MRNEDFNVQNFNAFHVTFHGATHTKPARAKIKSLRFREYIWISRGDNNHWEQDVVEHLQNLGFNIVGQAEYPGNGFLFFSDTFKPLKNEVV